MGFGLEKRNICETSTRSKQKGTTTKKKCKCKPKPRPSMKCPKDELGRMVEKIVARKNCPYETDPSSKYLDKMDKALKRFHDDCQKSRDREAVQYFPKDLDVPKLKKRVIENKPKEKPVEKKPSDVIVKKIKHKFNEKVPSKISMKKPQKKISLEKVVVEPKEKIPSIVVEEVYNKCECDEEVIIKCECNEEVCNICECDDGLNFSNNELNMLSWLKDVPKEIKNACEEKCCKQNVSDEEQILECKCNISDEEASMNNLKNNCNDLKKWLNDENNLKGNSHSKRRLSKSFSCHNEYKRNKCGLSECNSHICVVVNQDECVKKSNCVEINSNGKCVECNDKQKQCKNSEGSHVITCNCENDDFIGTNDCKCVEIEDKLICEKLKLSKYCGNIKMDPKPKLECAKKESQSNPNEDHEICCKCDELDEEAEYQNCAFLAALKHSNLQDELGCNFFNPSTSEIDISFKEDLRRLDKIMTQVKLSCNVSHSSTFMSVMEQAKNLRVALAQLKDISKHFEDKYKVKIHALDNFKEEINKRARSKMFEIMANLGEHERNRKPESCLLRSNCDCRNGDSDIVMVRITDLRRIGPKSVLLKWEVDGVNNVFGYEIVVNGIVKSKVFSRTRTSAILDFFKEQGCVDIFIYAIGCSGRYKPGASACCKV